MAKKSMKVKQQRAPKSLQELIHVAEFAADPTLY